MITKIIERIALVLGVVLIFSTANIFAAEKNDFVKITTSAQCNMCKKTIEKAVNELDGIESVELDVKTKIVTVEYVSSETNPDEIRKAISDSGYDADEVKADEKAYGNLMKCCRKK